MRSGTNLLALAGYNRAVILDVIRRSSEGISRVEVAQRTGLSAQTASNVCRRLLDDGYICETGTIISGVGKPRRILQLNPSGCFAVGIHLDPSVISVVLIDLAGTVVVHRNIETPGDTTVEENLDQIVATVENIVIESKVNESRISGIGFAAPGPIETATGALMNPPLLVNWDRMPIRDVLSSRLGRPVLLEKDVTAAAVAETWTGKPGGSFLFFYYGTGVGIGIALQNEVVRGSSGNAGDAGGLVVGASEPSAAGRGRRRLGEATSPRDVVNRAIERGILEAPGVALSNVAVRRLFSALALLASEGHAGAVEMLDEIAVDIAEGLVSVINVLDVERIVFGGPFWAPVSAMLLARIPHLVSRSQFLAVPHVITFDEATAGEDVAATGAACLVLDDALAPDSAMLLLNHQPT
ncbi:putative NBD/HSP70 family sugar kinase [Cryobacterium sp. MP_M5]|uniref:ROK family transcriptional regulator n=1 Tax=unclassified Cryobacterium TaxID=2649013 RepID=UPI0018CA49EC|nr:MULTISPECIES: ROK family transcriptional regulator [unclassified Cryobacterium]MBG6060132.1 putative NBD/HSP70 family sugar kinase [Cryobacterium sp. MP_M3]MEC5178575.1 putative NBD/HSP70 family sugar kinase [Cryobacterium sp. MP_M5]